MPSIKSYTQYETLAFCQSVGYHGSHTLAFEDVSTALNSNQLIRESETYDQTRLTATALRALYRDLLTEEANAKGAATVNGEDGAANGINPRKRKLSASPAPSDEEQADEQRLLQSLVDRLYARFREQAIKEITQDEWDYLRLQAEIAQLEKEEAEKQNQQDEAGKLDDDESLPARAGDAPPKGPVPQASPESMSAPSPPGVDVGRVEQIGTPLTSDARASPALVQTASSQPLAPSHPPQSASPALSPGRASTEPGQPRILQPPPAPPLQQSPAAFHRTLPIPSPQRSNYGLINPQHYQPGPQGQPVPLLPQYAGSPHMPPPTEYPSQKRGSSSSAPGRGSPTPGQLQQQQPYPSYPGYPQQPPWPHHPPAQQQYAQPPPFPSQPYYTQSPGGRPPPHYQTPPHPQYAPYPQSAPIHYQVQHLPPHAWPQLPPRQPYYGYHGSANVTPVPRSDSGQAIRKGRSSTPWKQRTQPHNGLRPNSPLRPDRDVSPISDTESPTRATKGKKSPSKLAQQTADGPANLRELVHPSRGRQQASATPTAFAGSRSQSIASFPSDTPAGKRRKDGAPRQIKAEPPSTPAAIPSDTEQQSLRVSGRRGKPRASTRASRTDAAVSEMLTNKRKRSAGHDSATSPRSVAQRLQSPTATATTRLQQPLLGRQFSLSVSNDPSLVVVNRSFGKTAQLLLNEINSHKHAGMFAKPLSERDAPGYKELVRRPQDLKSIKAALMRGAKAASAAIEAFEERTSSTNGDEEAKDEKTSTRATQSTTKVDDSLTGEGALGNGVYLLKVTEELMPPKAIVNSAQLEMELVRVSANAIMFNPLPSSERGFGRSLRLRRKGGDVAPQHKEDHDQREESSESDDSTSPEIGGIISDTREMFEDVMPMVRKWREGEAERLGNVGEADLISSTPVAGPSKVATQGSGSGNVSINPSLRLSESAENDDDAGGPSTPAASTMGTARKRRRIADA